MRAKSARLAHAVVCGAFLLLSMDATAAVIPGQIVARTGEVPPGAPVAIGTVESPHAEATGGVAFRGLLVDGVGYIFRGGQVVWLDTDDPANGLMGGESALGTNPAGKFIYSPTSNGDDSVYAHTGLLALEGSLAPDQPAGTNATFHSRPSMTLLGEVFWIVGLNSSGGAVTEERALVYSPDGSFGTAVALLQSGPVVNAATYSLGGFDIASLDGLDFDYQTSFLGSHLISVLRMNTGDVSNDHFVYVDGSLVVREDDPVAVGEDWDNFDLVTINESGNYAFSGDTDGSLVQDEFVAYEGQVVVREGDVVDGVNLSAPGIVRLISLNDNNVLVYAWAYSGFDEAVFFTCDPASAQASSRLLLTTGDDLDVDGDGIGDAEILDLLATATDPGRALANDGAVYLSVEIGQGGVTFDAIIRVQATCCGNGLLDPGEECDDGGAIGGDGCSALCVAEPANCGNGIIDPGEDCDDMDADDSDGCPSTCAFAVCGDGYVRVGVEECDDGNMSNDDGCLNNCSLALCGDGVLRLGYEDCDDGNMVDGDECTNGCQPAFCGDGILWAGVESCDDGNATDEDACAACETAFCGDGIIWAGVETCDDGNLLDDDGCPTTCTPAFCGDGFVQAGVEECDDQNDSNADACLDTCIAAYCGDGEIWTGVEECDDGDLDDGDACLTNCELAQCGDGQILTAVEECDDGNSSTQDGCVECKIAFCGDGYVRDGVEECDDGNDVDGDGCDLNCTIPKSDGSVDGTDTDSDGVGDSGTDPMGSTTASSSGVDPGDGSSGGEPNASGDAAVNSGGCTCSLEGSPTEPSNGLLPLGLLLLAYRRQDA